MTLKRWNNRSVNSIERIAVVGLSLLLTVNPITSTLRGARAEAGAPDIIPSTIPSSELQGAAAITHIKEKRLYDARHLSSTMTHLQRDM
ncbi:MAG TPA: hypothetical protein VJ810_01555 [Blastocatellia bacterium]|nr:hypothetical protein [Blastocatellia bacterium]